MASFLKRYSFLFLVLIGYFLWVNFIKETPCVEPIKYKIGYFDPDFGITKEDFLIEINKAISIWEKPIGKNLFEYDSNGKLTIDLIYDNRQKTTEQNQELQADVEKINALATSAKQEYLSLQKEHNAKEAEYLSLINNFQAKQKSYNDKVEYYNNQGGAPEDEYQRLQKEKSDLVLEQQNLENKRIALNSLVVEINAFINKYNLLVKDANSNINIINRSANQEFEEGIYDPNKDSIQIYEFSNKEKLVRVLAHEFGHALGIEHNENKESIMYSLNQGKSLSLSAEDLRDLKVLCKQN